jgi:predicted amidophosphoribosyltransferase
VGLVDLLLPQRCAGCGRPDVAFCDGCRARLTLVRGPLCDRCGAPVAWPVARCRDCAGRRLGFARARAAVAYEGPAVRVVWAWKEGGRRGLAREAAALVESTVDRPDTDAITFVPAVPERRLWRGHNPALGLARELSERWQLPLVASLARAGRPRRQRGLPPAERRRNVSGAFAGAAPAPGSVVLVDDVYTTGATVSEAARALGAGGCGRVEVVTFARALGHRGAGPAVR